MARAMRVALDLTLATTKGLAPKVAIIWRYAKIEMAPPMTVGYLHGAAGKKIEEIAWNATQSVINALSTKIREIDEAKEREKQEKEAAVRAALEKAKAEEKRKADEKKKEEAKLALEAKKALEEKQTEKAKKEPASKKTEPVKKKPTNKSKSKPK